MSKQTDDDEDLFRFASAPAPFRGAVERFCQDSGKTAAEMEQLTPRQIFEQVQEYYGENLSEFWCVWRDWHTGDDVQPMGDL